MELWQQTTIIEHTYKHFFYCVHWNISHIRHFLYAPRLLHVFYFIWEILVFCSYDVWEMCGSQSVDGICVGDVWYENYTRIHWCNMLIYTRFWVIFSFQFAYQSRKVNSFLIPSISVRSLIFALVKTEPRVDFHLIAFQLNRNILSLGCANVICIIIIVGDQFVYRNNGCRCQKSDSLNLKYWYDILLYTAKQYQHRYYSQRLFYSK